MELLRLMKTSRILAHGYTRVKKVQKGGLKKMRAKKEIEFIEDFS